MTNTKIILDAALASGIFTAEQVEEILSAGRRLPLHTFGEWKRMGFSVKKGEKARLACSIWKKSTKKAEKKENEEEKENDRFFLKLSYFFTADQVEPLKC